MGSGFWLARERVTRPLMQGRRPVTRLFLVLPPAEGAPERPEPSVDALAGLMADELAGRGVQVFRHVAGAPPEGSSRADVAIWLPDRNGHLPLPDERAAPARLHVGFCTGVDEGRGLTESGASSRFDALLVPHEVLVAPVRAAAEKSGRSAPEVVAVRLPAPPAPAREAAKAARRMGAGPVVLVDVREDFEATIERVVFQLALKSQSGAVVLLVPHGERPRARARELCERHAVDAWLASGPDALAASSSAVDLVVGRPSWVELLLAAAHESALLWVGDDDAASKPLLRALRAAGAVGEVTGVLQLAASLDGVLADPGGIRARGTTLREQLVGEARGFLDVLGSLSPRALEPTGSAVWEPVGPHARERKEGEEAVVEAREPGEPASDRAARIEEALSELKARMNPPAGEASPGEEEPGR